MKRFTWLVLLTACGARTEAAAAGDDIPNCMRIEGVPARYGDHSPMVKCLVDRYGWEPAAASSATAAFVEEQYQRVDSIELAEARRADSVQVAAQAAQAEIQRQRREAASAAAVAAKAADERNRGPLRAHTTGTPPERTFSVDYTPAYRGKTAVVKIGEEVGGVIERVYDHQMNLLDTYSASYRVRYADGSEVTSSSGFSIRPGLNRISVYVSGELLDRPVLIEAVQ